MAPLGAVRGTPGAVRGSPGAVRGTLDWDGEKVRVSGEKTLRKQTNRKKKKSLKKKTIFSKRNQYFEWAVLFT